MTPCSKNSANAPRSEAARDRVDRGALFGRRGERRSGARRERGRRAGSLGRFAQRAFADGARDQRVRVSREPRVGPAHAAALRHQPHQLRDPRAADGGAGRFEDALLCVVHARAAQVPRAHERAAAHQRLHGAQERPAIAGAARLRIAQQPLESESVAEILPDQTHEPLRDGRETPGGRGFADDLEAVDGARQRPGEHDRAERLIERGAVAVRDPTREMQAGRVERRRARDATAERTQPLRVDGQQHRFAHRVRIDLAAAERHANDVADVHVEVRRHEVGQGLVERCRAQPRQDVDDARIGHRRRAGRAVSRAPGARSISFRTARTVRGGTVMPYSTSPSARGRTKRNAPSRAFLSTPIAAISASDVDDGRDDRQPQQREQREHAQVLLRREPPGAQRQQARRAQADRDRVAVRDAIAADALDCVGERVAQVQASRARPVRAGRRATIIALTRTESATIVSHGQRRSA